MIKTAGIFDNIIADRKESTTGIFDDIINEREKKPAIQSPGIDVYGPQDFPTMKFEKPNRSRFDDMIDRSAAGLAMTGSGILTGLAETMELGAKTPGAWYPRRSALSNYVKVTNDARKIPIC